jgi:cystathionine beta-lyase/cystathionine gamma-synthase
MKSNQLIGLRALGESTSESAVFLFQKKEILKSCSFQTQAVQDAVVDEPDHAPALHVATSFSLRSSENSFIYSRSDCPTRARVEETLGRLEGGKAILFSSGMSAISTLLQALDPASVFLQNVGYTGTLSFLREHKVQVTSDEALFRAQSGKKVVFCEALRNGDSSVADLKALSTLAKEVGAAFVVDATFATPVLCRPIGTGAIVVHSLSKFIGGHSDVLAGAVATSDMAVYLKLRHLRHNLGNVPGNFEWFRKREREEKLFLMMVAVFSCSALSKL